MKYANLGCGSRYHPGFINIDIVAAGPGVIAHDLRQGIPLLDGSCDVVYHSNVLEHFRREDAIRFMQECFRVLKPGGIIRVAVPDLERICRLYLEKLEAARAGAAGAAADYEWIMLELYDQTVRERPGGGMAKYMDRDRLPNEAFVYERIGDEGRRVVSRLRQSLAACGAADRPRGLPGKLRTLRLRLGRLRLRLRQLRADGIRRTLAPALLESAQRQALNIGEFRLRGEVHQWMYDSYSLARLMSQAGFESPELQTADRSRVQGWASYGLDTLPDGSAIKPDSLFMEAIRPGP